MVKEEQPQHQEQQYNNTIVKEEQPQHQELRHNRTNKNKERTVRSFVVMESPAIRSYGKMNNHRIK